MEIDNAVKSKSSIDFSILIIITLIVGALGFCAFGIESLFNDSYERKVVGGDAYNHIIYGTRGTAFVGVGITLAVIANVVASLRRRA